MVLMNLGSFKLEELLGIKFTIIKDDCPMHRLGFVHRLSDKFVGYSSAMYSHLLLGRVSIDLKVCSTSS